MPDERPADFGHADLFTATDAEALFWQPLLDWIVAHRANRAYSRLRIKSGEADLKRAPRRTRIRSLENAAPIAVGDKPSAVKKER